MDIQIIPNSWRIKIYLLEGSVMESAVSFRRVLLLHIYQVALILVTLIRKNYWAKKQKF